MQNLRNGLAARVAGIQRRATAPAGRRGTAAGFGGLSAKLSRARRLVNQSRPARRP